MKKGFTLIELIIVVIVIGILATLAVPQYLKAVERTKGAKARHALGLIGQAEKMYRAEHDTYIACANSAAVSTNLDVYVEMADVSADTDWGYAVTIVAAPQGFTATATRSAGPNNAETVTMTESGVWAGTFTP
jgi:prepilin-type N-terminal cleavage/methylation domain-containing protein